MKENSFRRKIKRVLFSLPCPPSYGILPEMTGKTCEERISVLSNFLDEKTLGCLTKRYNETSNSSEFLKDLLEILCDIFPSNYGTKYEDLCAEDVPLQISSIALQIPALCTCATVFDVFGKYLQEFSDSGKTAQLLKVCKIISEVVKSCPLPWLLQVDENIENLEISDLETPKENIVTFLLSLLKQIDLMALNSEQLNCHPKLTLFPRILDLCHSVLQKLFQDSVEIPDVTLRNFKLAVLKKVACSSVMVCSQQIASSFWTSDISRKIALEFLKLLTVKCGCKDPGELLSGSDTESSGNAEKSEQRKIFPNGLLGNILQSTKHFMVKDKLPESPVAIHVLVWSIRKVKHPFLGRHFSMILPPLLLLVDDYRVDNRVTGIQSLEHVIENINATELCWYGRAEVIYEALHHRVHTNEPQVMYVLQPCLLKILKVIEPSPKIPTTGRRMNRCNQNFQIILSSMEFESKIALRRAYCSNLVKFIDHMGITVLCHFKRLMRVVLRYLEISDVETEEWRITMLDVLETIIIHAWPRIPSYADCILKCLLKLIIDVSTSSVVLSDAEKLIFVKIEKCFMLLLFSCGKPVEKQLEGMTTGLGHREAEELISRSLESYKSQTE